MVLKPEESPALDGAAAKRRDRMFLIAILVMMPALALGPALIAPEPGGLVAGSDLGTERGSDAGGETFVSSSRWHPAIERGSSLIGPLPGEGPGRPSVD
jgi:hypothetical protein